MESDSDVVESFYSNERKASILFEKYLNKLITEESIITKIKKETLSGGHILFHSPELYKRINKMHVYSFDNSTISIIRDNGQNIRTAQSYLSIDIFNGQDKLAKLSFLAGAYARYGKRKGVDYFFIFANSAHKVNLIATLLKEVKCSNISIESSNKPNTPVGELKIPNTFYLKFIPTSEISELFENVRQQLKESP